MKFNLYKSINEAYIHPSVVVDCDFENIVDILKQSNCQLANKNDAMMFNLCGWRDDFVSPEHKPGYIRRSRENVAQIYALLLDIDGSRTIESAVEEFIDYEFVIYSTYNNSKDKEKFRLILPLNQPLTENEFASRQTAMIQAFNVDRASFTISQAFYLPSYSSTNKESSFIEWNRTRVRYEALLLPAQTINDTIIPGPAKGEQDPMAPGIYRTLLSGHNMRYADALPIAVLCKSKGLGFLEFEDIVKTTAGADSSLRSGAVDLTHIWQQAYSCRTRYATMIDLMRRLNCDMWRWQVNN